MVIFKNYGDFLHTDQNLTSYDEQKALVYFQSSATNSMYKNPLQCWKKLHSDMTLIGTGTNLLYSDFTWFDMMKAFRGNVSCQIQLYYYK